MTRNEAHKLVFNAAVNMEGKEVDRFLTIIETLGLIEFDEEFDDKPTTVIAHELVGHFEHPALKAESLIKALYTSGYKIVKRCG